MNNPNPASPASPASPAPPASPPSPPSPTPAWQRPFDLSGNSQVEIWLEGERPSPPLIDEEEIDEFSVSSSSFANPSAKLGLVAGVALLAVLALWLVLSGTFAPPKAKSVSQPETGETSAGPEALAATPDASVGKLKTELALSQQEQQLAQLKQQKPSQKGQKPPQPTPKTSPPPPTGRVPSPPPPPRPAVAPRPSRSPSARPVVAASVRPAPRPVLPPPPPATKAVTPAIPVNPQEAWLAAAQLGSYGGTTGRTGFRRERQPNGRAGETLVSPPSQYCSDKNLGLSDEKAEEQGERSRERGFWFSPLHPAPRSPAVLTEQYCPLSPLSPPSPLSPSSNLPPDERPVLLEGQGGQGKRLPLGQSFRAQLADSLAWDGTVAEVRGVVKLLDPITSRDGEELAPAGSLVAVKLVHPSPAGLVKLEAEAIIVFGSEEDMEIPLPPNTLLVRGRQGKPLLAERLDRGDDGGGSFDWGGLLFDVGRTAAEFGLGGAGTNAYRDIYRFQRLESLYDRYFRQPGPNPYTPALPRQSATAWLLGAGLEVELYVNQSFEFGSRKSEFGN